jgi:hypothetical protein
MGKNLSDKFPIQNGLKQGDALSPLLFNFALVYAISRVQENQEELQFNGTRQLLAYADNINPLRLSGNYMYYMLWPSVMLHFVFMCFV